MILSDYQKKAERTMNPKLTKDETLAHGLLGLCAEAGEVAGLFQKEFQGHEVEKEHLVKELGDVLWMVAEIATVCELDLDDVARINIEKLEKRYPNGFEEARSVKRADGDV